MDSAGETTIPAHGKGFAETDLAIAVPAGTCKLSLSFVISLGPPFDDVFIQPA